MNLASVIVARTPPGDQMMAAGERAGKTKVVGKRTMAEAHASLTLARACRVLYAFYAHVILHSIVYIYTYIYIYIYIY